MHNREGINELLVQRAKFLMESERLLEDPVLVLAKRVEVLSWIVAATAVTQVALRIL